VTAYYTKRDIEIHSEAEEEKSNLREKAKRRARGETVSPDQNSVD
jgi:hypothetical protein